MRRHRMTDKEKMWFFVILFPVLWIFIPALLFCEIGEALKRWWYK